jgi:autotransporter-associated beta strand protein
VITNNGSSDSILTLGDFGADTGISTTYTQPVFNGIIQDGWANKLISTGNMTFAGGSLTAVLNSGPTAPVVLAEYGSLTGTPTVTFSPDLATTRLNSPVVDAITDNKVTLSIGGSVADLVWTGAADAQWNLTNVNWNNGGSGSAFFNLDKVAFTDAPAIKTMNLVETVTPGKMTVTSLGLNDYTFDGTGGIGGLAEGLVKNGDAWLNLGGDNTFTGPVQVNDGALILIKPQALGFTSGVTVASGGQLDVYGQLLADSNRSYNATISGDGDGTRAIVNSSTIPTISGITGKSGLRNLTLAADASVGGSGIFDIGTGGAIDGGGFT